MIYLVFIPLGILVLPWLAVRYVVQTPTTRNLPYMSLAPYLAAAALLWVVSFFVPNIPISAETTTFSQHATGGVVAAILFWYAARAYQWRFAYWWQEPAALYFFVGGLGVANELFELFLTTSGLIWVESSDVWWDLLANTCGACAAWGVAAIYRRLLKGNQQRSE